jgi:hypothetical protein
MNEFRNSMIARCHSALGEAASVAELVHAGSKGNIREILTRKMLESVLPPAIEVKSRLNSSNLRSAIASATTIRSLLVISTEHWLPSADAEKECTPLKGGTPLPITALFAFSSDLTGEPISELERYRSYDPNADTQPALQVICIYGRGYWYSKEEGWNYVAKLFSPGICWSGLSLNRCGSDVQHFEMNSKGVRPLSVFRRRPKL